MLIVSIVILIINFFIEIWVESLICVKIKCEM